MNRQQRRQMERKLHQQVRDIQDPKYIQGFREGQKLNNYEWIARITRLAGVKGFGGKTLEKIKNAIETPLSEDERERAFREFDMDRREE